MQLIIPRLAFLAAAGLVLALISSAPAVVLGDEWNLETRFSVNHQFEVPNKVLDANTEYVMRLHDSPANRRVVQILSEDGSELLTQFLAVSAERPEPEDETSFEFMEVDPGFPKPIKTWFYPGRNIGLEFVYSDEQMAQIAAHQSGRGLTEVSASAQDVEDVEDEEAYGVVPPQASGEAIAQDERTFQEEFDSEAEDASEGIEVESTQDSLKSQSESEIERAKPGSEIEEFEEAEPVEETESVEAAEELPDTAGELPLFGLLGMLCLGIGLGVRRASARS
jgi:hypothetical protein